MPTSIRNIQGAPVTLPPPWYVALSPGEGITVAEPKTQVVTILGGTRAARGFRVTTVDSAPDPSPFDAINATNNRVLTIHVAPNGSENNSGTEGSPTTLDDALRRIAVAPSFINDVILAPGEYPPLGGTDQDNYLYNVQTPLNPQANPILLSGGFTNELGDRLVTAMTYEDDGFGTRFVKSITSAGLALETNKYFAAYMSAKDGPVEGVRVMISKNTADEFFFNLPFIMPDTETLVGTHVVVEQPSVIIPLDNIVTSFNFAQIGMKGIRWQLNTGFVVAFSNNCVCSCEGVQFFMKRADGFHGFLNVSPGARLTSSDPFFFPRTDGNPFDFSRIAAGLGLKGNIIVGGGLDGWICAQDVTFDLFGGNLNITNPQILHGKIEVAVGPASVTLQADESTRIGEIIGLDGQGQATSPVITLTDGSTALIRNCKISGGTSDGGEAAIHVKTGSTLHMDKVTGGAGTLADPPNNGVGIMCDEASRVFVSDAGTTLQGAKGAVRVGDRVVGYADLLVAASATVPGADANGGVLYTGKLSGVRVCHRRQGLGTSLAVSIQDHEVIVDLATDGGGLATSTAADVVTAVNANAVIASLLTATATGTGLGLAKESQGTIAGADANGGLAYSDKEGMQAHAVQSVINQLHARNPSDLLIALPTVPASAPTIKNGTTTLVAGTDYVAWMAGEQFIQFIGTDLTNNGTVDVTWASTLTVEVTAKVVVVHLACTIAGVITSTAAAVKTAVEANVTANALVRVAVTGTGLGLAGQGQVDLYKATSPRGGYHDIEGSNHAYTFTA